MSGVGFFELVILFMIGLVVLGPQRLPKVANQLGTWIGQARRMTRVMKRQLEDELSFAEIEAVLDLVDAVDAGKPLLHFLCRGDQRVLVLVCQFEFHVRTEANEGGTEADALGAFDPADAFPPAPLDLGGGRDALAVGGELDTDLAEVLLA
jgi:sec-independent protein translocase protein TatB